MGSCEEERQQISEALEKILSNEGSAHRATIQHQLSQKVARLRRQGKDDWACRAYLQKRLQPRRH